MCVCKDFGINVARLLLCVHVYVIFVFCVYNYCVLFCIVFIQYMCVCIYIDLATKIVCLLKCAHVFFFEFSLLE